MPPPRPLLPVALSLLVASACGSTVPPLAPPPIVLPPSSASPAVPLRDPTLVSVAAVRAPAQLTLDGDLREWGSLLPPEPRKPEAAPRKNAPPEAPPPNPRDASSHVAVALTGEGALIAVDFGEAAGEGIWLGLGARPPELPELGQFFGRMGFVPFNCDQHPIVTEEEPGGDQGYSFEANAPESVAACEAETARLAAFIAQLQSRFARLFKIDRDGIHEVSPGGQLAAVEGAKAVVKPGPHGATAEISLPLAALPRLADAPLLALRLVARAATTPAPPVLGPALWVPLDLPEPVSFEPHGALRAGILGRAIETTERTRGLTSFEEPQGLSFQPGDPLHVEIVDSPGCASLVPRTAPLYQKEASFGDVEIGDAPAPQGWGCAPGSGRSLVISRAGKLVALVDPLGEPRHTLERDGEVHVFGWSGSRWNVVAVSADGRHRDALDVKLDGKEGPQSGITAFAAATFATFGLRGVNARDRVEVTWRWDPARKMYTSKVKRSPLPKKATPKKATPKKSGP